MSDMLMPEHMKLKSFFTIHQKSAWTIRTFKMMTMIGDDMSFVGQFQDKSFGTLITLDGFVHVHLIGVQIILFLWTFDIIVQGFWKLVLFKFDHSFIIDIILIDALIFVDYLSIFWHCFSRSTNFFPIFLRCCEPCSSNKISCLFTFF